MLTLLSHDDIRVQCALLKGTCCTRGKLTGSLGKYCWARSRCNCPRCEQHKWGDLSGCECRHRSRRSVLEGPVVEDVALPPTKVEEEDLHLHHHRRLRHPHLRGGNRERPGSVPFFCFYKRV